MAWWDIDDELMIGDPVVDRLARQLRGGIEQRAERGLGPPTLRALLSAIADGLRKYTAVWCGATEDVPFEQVMAHLERPAGHVELVPQDEATDPDLAIQIAEAFEEISLIYEDVLDRKPRRTELLAVVRFLLSADPEDYVAVSPGSSVIDVMVVANGFTVTAAT